MQTQPVQQRDVEHEHGWQVGVRRERRVGVTQGLRGQPHRLGGWGPGGALDAGGSGRRLDVGVVTQERLRLGSDQHRLIGGVRDGAALLERA